MTHTLYLVDEKCEAISSYTECTCCDSYSSPWGSDSVMSVPGAAYSDLESLKDVKMH